MRAVTALPTNHGEIVKVLGGTILTDAQVQARLDGGQRYDAAAADGKRPGRRTRHGGLRLLDGGKP
jgi:hypothetical protein